MLGMGQSTKDGISMVSKYFVGNLQGKGGLLGFPLYILYLYIAGDDVHLRIKSPSRIEEKIQAIARRRPSDHQQVRFHPELCR